MKCRLTIAFGALLLLTTACAQQPLPAAYNPPGFFSGIVHGFLLPIEFAASWFADYRIYAFPNSGVLYDLGYLIGLPFSSTWFFLIASFK